MQNELKARGLEKDQLITLFCLRIEERAKTSSTGKDVNNLRKLQKSLFRSSYKIAVSTN